MSVPIKNEFITKEILKARYLFRTMYLNFLIKNKPLTLIVYLNDSNIMFVIQFSIELNITGNNY